VAGRPDESLLVKAVRHADDTLRMPPKNKLSDNEIATLTRWVRDGLPWPEVRPTRAAAAAFTEEQRRFWSFQPVRDPHVPQVRDAKSAIRNPVDAFVRAKLQAAGLEVAPPADRRTLIRRATFDLTGLPPTPEEVEAFVRDSSPDAYAKVIDRLLASPAYSEKWGRHWLDLVRYADSFDARGLGGPSDIAEAWRYRDWVIRAFNRDLPYDRFLQQQIAGDLLPETAGGPLTPDGIVATGMLAIGNWGGGDADKEKLLTDIADDQVDVVGRTVLGLTVACARCHDHKFDPITTADYYALAGIFFSTHILPDVGPKTNGPNMLRIPLDAPAERERRARLTARITALERLMVQLVVARGGSALTAGLDEEIARLRTERDDLRSTLKPQPVANGAQEGGVPGSPHTGTHDVRVHIRGRYDRLGELVPRRFPAVLAGDRQPPITHGSGRRELAEWLTRPDNPLTARVMVNRLWQHHFGEGIVRTPSNFGQLGERPTHPELLDWLAARFVEGGWSVKRLHRLIMLSAAYQQSGTPPAETLRHDPDNKLWGRQSRRRLTAEELRDGLLAATGRLDRAAGGPADRDFARPRRTVYQMTVRSDRSGFGPLFDAADPTAPVDRRTESTVAPQALFLLNHPFVKEQARAVASQILRSCSSGQEHRIRLAYALLFGRPPTEQEVQVGREVLQAGKADEQRWTEYCHMLLAANEFSYVD
jgi:hypothetical protein